MENNKYNKDERHVSMKSAIYSVRKYLIVAGVFSGLINLLMLSGSLFMLQVYDRVIPSHSKQTLIALLILIVILYLLTVLLETSRSRLFSRIGRHLDIELRSKVFDLNVKASLPGSVDGSQLAFKDLEQVRGFLASGGPSAIFDLPWMPIYCIMLFLLHPYIGILGLIGIFLLTIVTFLADKATTPIQQKSNSLAHETNYFAELIRTSAETLFPLGMHENMKRQWLAKNQASGESIILSSDKISFFSGISRFIRMSLQSFMLALGALLAITGDATGGIMIASSIILGKALAPVELAISHWRSFANARQSYKRISKLLEIKSNEGPITELPIPSKNLSVQNLVLSAPGSDNNIIEGISFEAVAGDVIGVIGPSGSGKSTLARAIVGIWPIKEGKITFDNATLNQWSEAQIGEFLGYVPQAIDLFSGTIAQNISRFEEAPKSQQVIEAAQNADLENFIKKQSNGYDTDIGFRGALLSAGQRQRLALSRALYKNPFLIVMDEPNSALDGEGEAALLSAIAKVKNRSGIVILVAHRPNILQATNKVLVIAEGRQKAFGARDEIMRKILMPQNIKNQEAAQV